MRGCGWVLYVAIQSEVAPVAAGVLSASPHYPPPQGCAWNRRLIVSGTPFPPAEPEKLFLGANITMVMRMSLTLQNTARGIMFSVHYQIQFFYLVTLP